MNIGVVDGVLLITIVLISIVLHENAHGWTALALGDPTAKAAGRLTLNPIPHLDPVGSVILPALMAFTTGGAFGYAKPIPVTPSKLRGTDGWGFAVVALAGPVSNVALAFAGSLVIPILFQTADFTSLWFKFWIFFVQVNIFLAAFNLVPIPPLDGSRLLRVVLAPRGRQILDQIEPYGFVIILILVVWLDEPFFRFVGLIESFIVRVLPL